MKTLAALIVFSVSLPVLAGHGPGNTGGGDWAWIPPLPLNVPGQHIVTPEPRQRGSQDRATAPTALKPAVLQELARLDEEKIRLRAYRSYENLSGQELDALKGLIAKERVLFSLLDGIEGNGLSIYEALSSLHLRKRKLRAGRSFERMTADELTAYSALRDAENLVFRLAD